MSEPMQTVGVSSEWVIGWKIANLVYDMESGRIEFVQMVIDGLVSPYGAIAEATCNMYPAHVSPPVAHCHCGFNAFDDEAAARRMWRGWTVKSPVLLRVGLSGDVIEGTYTDGETWGYKAQHQWVTDVFVPARCFVCEVNLLDETPYLCVSNESFTYTTRYLKPACEKHAGDRVVTAEQLGSELVDVEVHWHDAPLKSPEQRGEAMIAAPKPVSSNVPYGILAVNVNQATSAELMQLGARRGMSITEVVDRAARLYDLLEQQRRNKQTITFRRPWSWKRFWRLPKTEELKLL